MYFPPLLGRLALPCLLFLFVASPAPIRADYTPPTTPGQLVGDFMGFVSDFSNWNTSQHNEPLLLLELTPAQNQGDMVFLLFWFWLNDQLSGGPPNTGNADLPAAPPTPSNPGLPGPSGGGSTTTPGNGPSSGDGPSSGILPPPNPGAGPGGNSDFPPYSGPPSSGGGSSPGDPSPPNTTPAGGSNPGSPPPSNPPPSGGSGGTEPPGDPVPAAPEPASVALLSTGALGFWVLGITRRRQRSR